MKFRLFFLGLLFIVPAFSKPARLLIFTGSDWCPNCRRLEKKILKDTLFINFARDNIRIEFVDFPQHVRQDPDVIARNKALAEKYNFMGVYPTILLLNAGDSLMGQIFYKNQSPEEFIEQIRLILPGNKQ